MALGVAADAASLAWRLRGLAAVGGAIGIGTAADDFAVGVHAVESIMAMPKVVAGLGGAYLAGRYIKGRMKDDTSESAKMLMPGRGRKRPRTDRTEGLNDYASYKQLSSTKRKYGKKISTLTRQIRLLKTTVEPIRYRFGTAQDVNAPTGAYWLSNQNLDSINRALPLFIMPLFTVRNGGGADTVSTSGRGMYQLCRSTAGFNFRPVFGVDPTSGSGLVTSWRQVPPSITGNDGPGRKGLCDWTRHRFCFWGKKKNPTNIRVTLIKFLDEELCPDFYDDRDGAVTPAGTPPTTNFGSVVTSKAAEWYALRTKYLLNGHLGVYNRFDRGKYARVIKQWNINFNPIDAGAETDASDGRAHMRHLDIFNRWNRGVDFTDRGLAVPQSYTDTLNINAAGQPNDAFTGYPKNPNKGIYIMIESVQPVAIDVAAADNPPKAPADGSDYTASFDVLAESNWTIMKF